MRQASILTFTFLLLTSICLSGQPQQGVVKALGKPGQKGKPIESVVIRAVGQHNPVLSDSNGEFLLPLGNLKDGDGYAFHSIHKKGYVLVDDGLIGRTFAYSSTVPIQITMTTQEQLQEEKLRIEANAYRVAESEYKSQSERLERALAEQTISEEFYREQIKQLRERFERFQLMIDSLSDHYAKVDYDELSESDIEINICIETGDIDHAFELLDAKLNPGATRSLNYEAISRVESVIAASESMMKELQKKQLAILEQQKIDGEDLYRLYTIALARFDNLLAAKYIQTRAELDTTILDWQIDAGRFLENYISDFAMSKVYYDRSKRLAESQYGKEHYMYARTLNLLGSLSSQEARFEDAANYHYEALAIQKQYPDNPDASVSLDNLGVLYSDLDNFKKAIQYHQQSLQWKERFPEDSLSLAISYNNIGVCKSHLKQYKEALQYQRKALTIFLGALGENSLDVSLVYANIGEVLFDIGDYKQALDYMQKSLTIRKKIFGDNHPYTAVTLNNIAGILSRQNDNEGALDCMEEALRINRAVYGNHNPEVALCLNNIGGLYCEIGMYSRAIDSLNEALIIYQNCFGEISIQVADTYKNLSGVYLSSGDYTKSFDCYKMSKTIRKKARKMQRAN